MKSCLTLHICIDMHMYSHATGQQRVRDPGRPDPPQHRRGAARRVNARSTTSSTRSTSISPASRATCGSCRTPASSPSAPRDPSGSTRCAPSPSASWTPGSTAIAACGRRASTVSPRRWRENKRRAPPNARSQIRRKAVMTEKRRITMERTYKAPIEDVWELWTTKEGIESWWGPDGFYVKVRNIDLRPGGKLEYQMIASGADADRVHETGRDADDDRGEDHVRRGRPPQAPRATCTRPTSSRAWSPTTSRR